MILKKHIIHQPQPYHRTLIALIAMIISAGIVWFYIQLENQDQLQKFDDRKQLIELYREQLIEQDKDLLALENINKELLSKTIGQQSEIEIQAVTEEQLWLQQNTFQEEISALKKELLFYQSITQGGNSSDLKISELHLSKTDIHDDIVRYRVVVTQGKKIRKPIKGSVSISLRFLESNGEVSTQVLGKHSLNLRHVQILEGRLTLVPNTLPESVTVVLTKSNKKKLSRTFDWQQSIDN